MQLVNGLIQVTPEHGRSADKKEAMYDHAGTETKIHLPIFSKQSANLCAVCPPTRSESCPRPVRTRMKFHRF